MDFFDFMGKDDKHDWRKKHDHDHDHDRDDDCDRHHGKRHGGRD
jgi:ABC-type nickel/cobalt efflux system permease component RcnA